MKSGEFDILARLAETISVKLSGRFVPDISKILSNLIFKYLNHKLGILFKNMIFYLVLMDRQRLE